MNTSTNLAEFLRAARARVQPQDVGLGFGSTAARRVPGLRRDEVALLAGMSVDYYTRMEQGRIKHASDAIVNGLCKALRLNATERSYLFSLFSPATTGRQPQAARATKVRPIVRQMLDQMDNAAAFVLGVGMEVLAMNDLAKKLMPDFTAETGLARSLARWTFLAPEARTYFREWDVVAADMTAILRRDSSRHPNDRALNELIGELTVKSEAFQQWWPQHMVYECSFGTKKIAHPLVGSLDIEYETFPVPEDPDQQLFIYMAKKGSPTDDALRILGNWSSADAVVSPLSS
ncbi:XRE family transcriptional regulator [Mycetocola tolaasinivorans]|uniref:XRE family transcriptional regulator n=1 Tax=Mycetocola tolaasinivorans TaxID=76635 RepID=A0A3L7A3T4_9MICO|nr:helix-turn-helix transcriptional regulator [Mycetocola tolaasinivorans]RLP74774.1 XRE family transcriptional regulator [Mycetocola tolaasinivorans]